MNKKLKGKKIESEDHKFYVDPLDTESYLRHSYEPLLEFLKIKTSKKVFEHSLEVFEKELKRRRETYEHIFNVLGDQPLFTAFLIWSKDKSVIGIDSDPVKLLLEQNLIQFDDENGNLLLIRDIQKPKLLLALEEIRCQRQFDIDLREKLVVAFLYFITWLRVETFRTAFDIEDPDKVKSQGRLISHDVYIKLLSKLDDRCQLVAKLLYLGGSRTLDEVLTLKIQNVNFKKQIIKFDSQLITYSKHVFEDIKDLIEDRSTGPLFIGRQNTPLNPSTVFRNFKDAASQIGLGDSFSPKALTTSC